MIAALALGLLAAAASGVRAQTPPPPWQIEGSTPTTAPAVPRLTLGAPVALEGGPWVLGEVLFFQNGSLASDYAWRDQVRGKRGVLYTQADVLADVDRLYRLEKFEKITPSLFEIPNSPVPQEFATIAASTSNVRLVFEVVPKAVAVSSAPAKFVAAPAPISGMILTPTAWRGTGRFTTPGLGLDFNGMYVIGRLYGKNNFVNSTRKTNYIDRIGLWLLSADGKMQLQSESDIRPAVAVGGRGTFMFRDSPQPRISDTTGSQVAVNASQKSTKLLTDAYFVASKKMGPVRTSVGVMQGNFGDAVANFSEFLTPDALTFLANQRGQTVRSRTMPFLSVFGLPKPSQQLGVELIKFNGAALNPWMLNFKIGYFLKLNFDVAYIHFQGGYDVLGLIQFRFNQFPRR